MWRLHEVHPRSYVSLHEKCRYRFAQNLCPGASRAAQAATRPVNAWHRIDKKRSSVPCAEGAVGGSTAPGSDARLWCGGPSVLLREQPLAAFREFLPDRGV